MHVIWDAYNHIAKLQLERKWLSSDIFLALWQPVPPAPLTRSREAGNR